MLNRYPIVNGVSKSAAARCKWKEWQSRFNPESEHVIGNNVVLTGRTGPQHPYIYVIDFDPHPQRIREMYPIVTKLIRDWFPPVDDDSYIVETGSQGLHLYLEIIDPEEDNDELHPKLRNRTIAFPPDFPLLGIDGRGQGGFVFGEGTDFNNDEQRREIAAKREEHPERIYHEHTQAYRRLSGEAPTKVSTEQLVKFFDFIASMTGDDARNARKPMMAPQEATPIPVAGISLWYESPLTESEIAQINNYPIRLMYKLMLSGELRIHHLWQHPTQYQEYLYWKGLFLTGLALVNRGAENTLNEWYDLLEKTQPEFDRVTSQNQIRYILTGKPFCYHTYAKYFAPWLLAIKDTPPNSVGLKLMYETVNKRVGENQDNARVTTPTPGLVDDDQWLQIMGDRLLMEPTMICYIADLKEYAYWNETAYEINTLEVERITSDFVQAQGEKMTKRRVDDLLWYLRSRRYYQMVDFNKDLNKLIFTNGVYNTQTGELTPNTPEYLGTLTFPFDLLLEQKTLPAGTERYINSLTDNIPERNRLLTILRWTFDNTMVKSKYFSLLFGPPDSGKSKLTKKVANAYGLSKFSLLRIEKLENQFALGPTVGKKFLAVDDSAAKTLSSIVFSILKNLTSGFMQESEKKGKDPTTTKIEAAIWITCNKLFGLPYAEKIDAFVNRALIWEFQKSFTKADPWVDEWADDMTDTQQLVSYCLCGFTPESLTTFSHLPLKYADQGVLSFWKFQTDYVFGMCTQLLKARTGFRVSIDAVLEIVQEALAVANINIWADDKKMKRIIRDYIVENLKGQIQRSHGVEYALHISCEGVEDQEIPKDKKALSAETMANITTIYAHIIPETPVDAGTSSTALPDRIKECLKRSINTIPALLTALQIEDEEILRNSLAQLVFEAQVIEIAGEFSLVE